MVLDIKYQDSFSRIQLLVRSLFGWFYICIPHAICLFFMGIAARILQFISFWGIIYNGKYPKDFFNFQVKYLSWQTRVRASLFNLIDPYPKVGLESIQKGVELEIPYNDNIRRSDVFIRGLFGVIYVGLPHGFFLFFRIIATQILIFLSFWIVLFTGCYPKSFHSFNVGTIRWLTRVASYLGYLTHDYPIFSGK